MYQNLLFDLDGTIIDSAQGIMASAQHSLKQFGIEDYDNSKLLRFIGPPLHESFEQIYGFSTEQSRMAVQYYREHYKDIGIHLNVVYAGIEDVLRQLQAMQKRLVIATCKPEPFAIRILENLGLAHYFDCITGAALDHTRRTKTEVITCALQRCAITDHTAAVMIGDRSHDVLGAAACGLPSIGVLYGYGSLAELQNAGATHIAPTPAEILSCIAPTP